MVIDYSSIKGYHEHMMLNEELNNMSGGGVIRNLVQELEQVKAGELDKCVFGFECTLIEVYKKGNEKYSGKVYISFNYGEQTLETDLKIEDILKMMTDRRDYIDKWEKDTGKVLKNPFDN